MRNRHQRVRQYLVRQRVQYASFGLFQKSLSVVAKIQTRHFSGGTNERPVWDREDVKNREGGLGSLWDKLFPLDSSVGRGPVGQNEYGLNEEKKGTVSSLKCSRSIIRKNTSKVFSDIKKI